MITIYTQDDCPKCEEAMTLLMDSQSDLIVLNIGDDPVEHFCKLDVMAFLQMNNNELPVIQCDGRLFTFDEWSER